MTAGMLEDSVTEPENKKLLEKIKNTASGIEMQMLFSREFKEAGANLPGWVDLDATLSQSLIMMELDGVEVENDLKGLEVYADPLIRKVFPNLVDNAIRHGNGVSRIRFSYHGRGEDVVITCEDNGAGVHDGIKTQIFNKYFGRNHGLGLYLVREILSIYVLSISETGKPGEGARFEILVPKGSFRILQNAASTGEKGSKNPI